MAEKMNIYEVKAHLSKVIARVQETGEVITICKNGKPVVDLVQHRPARNPLKADPELLGAVYHGDPCAGVGKEDWPEGLR
jgi:prevent-host-death family protein